MKKSFSLLLVFCVLICCFSSPVFANDAVDPVVGAWYKVSMAEDLHYALILFFYPDGVMWDHQFLVENDAVKVNYAKEKHWNRDAEGNLIIDSRNKKLKAEFIKNDFLCIMEDDGIEMYARFQDSAALFFQATVSDADHVYDFEPGKGYVVGKDISAGYYLFDFDFSFGRFYIYSSEDSFSKEYATLTSIVGSETDQRYNMGEYLTDGQVIKVNQSGCVGYCFE